MEDDEKKRIGSKGAPDRHTINWQQPLFYDEDSLNAEMDRVFEVCHGCRRCLNLCQAFPNLFDFIDESDTGDFEAEKMRTHYPDIAEQCYLCDRCYMNKCPYTPPHEWAIDFPHLMLRQKAQSFKKNKANFRDNLLTSTEKVGSFAGIPIVKPLVNKITHTKAGRHLLDATLNIAKDVPLPNYHSQTLRHCAELTTIAKPIAKVVLFTTCYGNYNQPHIGQDMIKVFEHNQVEVVVPKKQACCGMPKLELGDLETVKKYKDKNIKILLKYIEQGYDIIAPIPSCVLMFKQELPLLFANETDVIKIRDAMYDPFEYLFNLHKQQLFKTDFLNELGEITYHVACHLEVQNIGPKTQQILKLIPGIKIKAISRCSGHNGTYAVKKECNENALRIGKPVFRQVDTQPSAYLSSDCPMALEQIAYHTKSKGESLHPISLLRKAYGI